MDVDEIGTFLEHQGFSDEEIDEYFEHFGKKGMKWGVRKSKEVTGVGRARGAVIDRNDRMISMIGKARSGEKYKVSVAIGKVFAGGKAKQNKNWDKTLKKMHEQNGRLMSKGKLSLSDRFHVVNMATPVGLLLSKRPTD